MTPSETPKSPNKKQPATLSLQASTIQRLHERAKKEQRSRSNMADVLLNAALNQREQDSD